MMTRPIVAIGHEFGRWRVVGRAPTRRRPSGTYAVYWSCLCECGVGAEVQQQHLVDGRSRSCGCWRREAASLQMKTHGGRHTSLYEVWTQMLQRCKNLNNKSFSRYGARGINVCGQWHDYAVFQSWAMDHGYADGLTIDREDNDGDYEPTNCRWVPNVDNCRNSSIALRVSWDGVEVALNTLAEFHGIKPGTVYSRYQLMGWTLRQALGLDPAPTKEREPISEATRQRMRTSALTREQLKREKLA